MQKTGIFCKRNTINSILKNFKWGQAMRIGAFIICAFIGTGSLLEASPGHGQTANSQRFSVKYYNVSLSTVLSDLEQKANVVIMYESSDKIDKKKVTISLKEKKLSEILDSLVFNRELKWSIKDNIIRIQEASDTATQGVDLKSTPLSPSLTPPITVRGRIVNENGEPVVASVIVKGTSKGTTSNENGEFELNNVDEEAELVITSATTEALTVKIDSRSSINISVKSLVSDLDAVVINKGYYSESRRLSTGNVAKVDAKDIARQPVVNSLQAIQGRMAGVFITQSSGVPGGKFEIEIRGRNSLRTDGNAALYVIDGVPYPSVSFETGIGGTITGGGNPLSNINVSEIESVEVLKDADATAIYGSRGANGVLLVTTKKGKAGKTKVDLNVYTGVGKVARKLDLLNTRQYLDMRYEAFANDNVQLNQNSPNAYDLIEWDTTRSTDWQKELIGGSANVFNAQSSLNWGNSNTQFLIGAGYYRESTVYSGNFFNQRASFNFNINHTSDNKKFKSQFSGRYLNDKNNLLASDLTRDALVLPSNAPALYDSEGKLNWENNTWINPLANAETKYTTGSNNFIGNSNLSYELIHGLKINANMGFTRITQDEIRTMPKSSASPNSIGFVRTSNFGNSSLNTWIIEPGIEYKLEIGSGKFSILAGSTFQQSVSESSTLNATGYSSDALMQNLKAAPEVSVIADNYFKYRYEAVFGRINYNYNDKYLINLTGRRDGSSRFGPGKQFANFGAVGAAWVFSHEPLIEKSLAFLSYGKIRFSYGTTGSDQINNYQYLDLWSSTGYAYGGVQGVSPSILFNPDYAWEENRKFEVALDLGFLKDRILLSSSFYHNRSSSQLVGIPLSAVTGFYSIQANFPALVKNTGLEIELNTINISRRDFRWNTSFNITIPRNKLVSFDNIASYPVYNSRYVVGKSLNIVNAYHFLGVDPSTGVYTFEDVDGNNVGTNIPEDLQAIKINGYKFYGGLQNNFSFKGFELSIFIQFVKQNGNEYLFQNNVVPGMISNQPIEVLDRWRKAGDITNIQKFTQDFSSDANAAFNAGSGDNRISDASFIRLKNISLSYQFNNEVIKKLQLQNVRAYIQAQNLVTLTRYKGLDPESQSISTLPPLRMVTCGLQIGL